MQLMLAAVTTPNQKAPPCDTATSNCVLRVRYVALGPLGTHRNYLVYLIRRHSLASLHLECNIGSKQSKNVSLWLDAFFCRFLVFIVFTIASVPLNLLQLSLFNRLTWQIRILLLLTTVYCVYDCSFQAWTLSLVFKSTHVSYRY